MLIFYLAHLCWQKNENYLSVINAQNVLITVIGEPSMDFSKVDLLPILKSSIPRRFMDMSPQDFELFIAQFFHDSGYVIEDVKHGSDYGIDIIASSKEKRRIGIQVKRYAENNKVGVSDVNQAIGGGNYYDCDKIIFLTTSKFTDAAKRLAQKANIELWDWDIFVTMLSEIYLDQKAYQEYFENEIKDKKFLDSVRSKINNYDYLIVGKKDLAHVFFIEINNQSDRNLKVQVLNCTYITYHRKQISFMCHITDYFVEGIIYAKCSVICAIPFGEEQLNYISEGDKIILDLSIEGNHISFNLDIFNSILTIEKIIEDIAPNEDWQYKIILSHERFNNNYKLINLPAKGGKISIALNPGSYEIIEVSKQLRSEYKTVSSCCNEIENKDEDGSSFISLILNPNEQVYCKFVSSKVHDQNTHCIIATTVYGTELADEVKTLIMLRDNVLIKSKFGLRLINFYYTISPPFANYIYHKKILKMLIRKIIFPIVWLSRQYLYLKGHK